MIINLTVSLDDEYGNVHVETEGGAEWGSGATFEEALEYLRGAILVGPDIRLTAVEYRKHNGKDLGEKHRSQDPQLRDADYYEAN